MKILLIDTETTGLKDPQVIEVSGIYLNDDLTLNSEFSVRYKPTKDIELQAMIKHGITEEDLINEKEYDFKLPENIKYLIGHNVDFDWLMIGKPEVKLIDTMSMARSIWPEAQMSLEYLTYYLTEKSKYKKLIELIRENLHSSIFDCKLTFNLLKKIIENTNADNIEKLYELSERSRIIDKMPYGKHKNVLLTEVPIEYLLWLYNELIIKDSILDKQLTTAIKTELDRRQL